jgi:hypothetical protein
VSDPPTYTLKAFCAAHHISMPFLYKLRSLGQGPEIMEVGSRRLVTGEAAAAWRRKRKVTT